MDPAIKSLLALLLFLSFPTGPFCFAEKIYLKDGQVREATIINRTRDSIWLSHDLGSIGISLDDIDKILDDDGSVSKFDLKTMTSLLVSYIKTRDYKMALSLSDKLVGLFPEDRKIRYLRAGLNHMAGNYGQATADYEFLIQNKAADAKVYNDLGSIYAIQRQDKKAAELFNLSIKEDPGLIQPHNNLAELSLRLKDYSRAEEQYNAVLALEPGNKNALYNLGVVYMDRGDFARAKAQWEKVLLIDPEDQESINALGQVIVEAASETEN